ncbi:major capsid protein [Escherichia coli]|nr:major capsid protein [Escherichia coli]MCV8638238.1 major capsid protein [Escherichia coli]HBD1663068.1 major capsid protein [Escherichia coli]
MSMYTTAQLLAANEQKFKFDPLFLRLFFRESYPFTTEKVYLSQIPGLVNMALYVSPIVSGEVIEAYALNASGVVNIIVFDPKGWALFRSFKAVKEKLDTRRGSNSELETAVKDLGEAVSYKGMYGDTAIVVYSGQYVENDVKKNFLPDNTMVLGNTQARGLRTYGCIQDADAQREGINASARYPKNWVTTGDPAREFTMIQSAPLMLLADPDAFVSVQLA